MEGVVAEAEHDVQRLDLRVVDAGGSHSEPGDVGRRQQAGAGARIAAVVEDEPVDIVLAAALDDEVRADALEVPVEVVAGAGERADVDHVVAAAGAASHVRAGDPGADRVGAVRERREEAVARYEGLAQMERMSISSLPLRPSIRVVPVCVLTTMKMSLPWPRTMLRSSAKPS